MDVAHLLVALDVELADSATGRGVERLLKIRVETAPAADGLVADLVALVEPLGALRGVVLLVEVVQDGGEARGDAVLAVQSDGLLERLVAEDVAVRQVLGHDARARLVLLREVVLVLVRGLGGAGGIGAGDVVEVVRRRDVHGGGAQLGVVQEQSGLRGAVQIYVSDCVIRSVGGNIMTFGYLKGVGKLRGRLTSPFRKSRSRTWVHLAHQTPE